MKFHVNRVPLRGVTHVWSVWRLLGSLLVIGCGGFRASTAQAAERLAAAAPRIEFVETTHDFGRVKRGENVSHTFVFKNAGTALLEITQVVSGCGCTTIGDWDRQAAPGKNGRITFEFASGTFNGAVHKTITVMSNDPVRPASVLELAATVWTPIEVSPAVAMFHFTPETSESETRVIRILNHQAEPLALAAPASSNRAFKADLRTLKPGKDFELAITTVPPLGPGNISATITTRTSSSETPLITVEAHGVERPAILISPIEIVLPKPPLRTNLKSTVSLMGMAPIPLVLSDPKLSAVGPVVELREVQPGRLFALSVEFPAGFSLPAGEKVELTVGSNHPRHPVIRIPITDGGRP